MRKQDYLVDLIAALEPNEKHYFKLFTGLQPGEKRYLKLFDALDRKKTYASAELCKELGVQPWQLADDKHYLTQTLLQSLCNYDHDSTELAILRNNKENAQALINRRIFGFASDIIEKTLKKAWELEAFEMIVDLLIMRTACWQNSGVYPEKDDSLEKHALAAVKLKEIVELTSLRKEAKNLEKRAANLNHFEKILAHPLISGNVNKLKSLRAKSLYYEIHSHYHGAAIDEHAILQLARKERQLYLRHPEIKIINPLVYLANISRLASGETDFELSHQMIINLQKELVDPQIKISSQRRNSLMWSCYLITLWNLRHLHRFKEALPIAEKTYIESAGRTEYDRLSIGLEYALILLHNDEASLAAGKTDELLRIKSDTRFNMQVFIRMVHIMAHLQLGNYAIMPNSIKSARFWVKKNKAGHEEVNIFFKHISSITKAGVDKREAWRGLLQVVDAGKLETMKRLLQFDVWVKAMIKKS